MAASENDSVTEPFVYPWEKDEDTSSRWLDRAREVATVVVICFLALLVGSAVGYGIYHLLH